MQATRPDISLSEKWIQHQRRLNRLTRTWAYAYCSEHTIVSTEETLSEHGKSDHKDRAPTEKWKLPPFKAQFIRDCEEKFPKQPLQTSSSVIQGNRPLLRYFTPLVMSISGKGALSSFSLEICNDSTSLRKANEDDFIDYPRKWPAIGSGISQASAATCRDASKSPPRRRPEARLASIKYGDTGGLDLERPRVENEFLPEDGAPPSRLWFLNPSNSGSNNASNARIFQEQSKDGKAFHCSSNEIILQPETRPISQEQLLAEVEGVHEHHDFFLAAQHPSASPALRRLAFKYTMPARIWRHSIHHFLGLLLQKPLESLDHMLTFIYLAYSMMALLYETVPAFVDTWIECLGDLARYRKAIEDDNIRDIETWVGDAKHRYLRVAADELATKRFDGCFAPFTMLGVLQPEFHCSKSVNRRIHFDSRDHRELAHPSNIKQHNERQSNFESKASKSNLVPDNRGHYRIIKQQPLSSGFTGRFEFGFLNQLSSHPFILILCVWVSQTTYVLALPPECVTRPTEESIFEALPLAGTLLAFFIGILYSREIIGDDAVAITPIIVNIALVKLRNDERFSTGHLAAAETFSLALNVALLKPRLDNLKRTGALTWFLIAFLGCGSTFTLDYLQPPITGLLADPFVAFAIRGLPITLGWSFIWIAFIEKPGLAERIDNGDYDGHIGAFFQWFIVTLRHVVHITIDLLVPRLLEVWMNRFLVLNNIRGQQPFDMEAGIDVRFPGHDQFPDFLAANAPIPRPRDDFPNARREEPEDF